MSATLLISMTFGCFGFGCAVAAVSRHARWGFVAFLGALLVVSPLWRIAAYVEQIAQAKP